MYTIAVVDGQGGGIGSLIVKRLREHFGDTVEIVALGTNAAATTAMLKARANKGATGENAIVHTAGRVDVITGPLGIILANAMMGELTPKMSIAIASSTARKILLPLNREKVEIVGACKDPLPHLVEALLEIIAKTMEVHHV